MESDKYEKSLLTSLRDRIPLSRQMLGIGELGQRGISRETGSGFSIAPDPCNGIEYHMFLVRVWGLRSIAWSYESSISGISNNQIECELLGKVCL